MGNWAPDICTAYYSCAWVSKFMEANSWRQLCLHFQKIQLPELVLLCLNFHAWRTKTTLKKLYESVFHRLKVVYCFYQNTAIGGGSSNVPQELVHLYKMYEPCPRAWGHGDTILSCWTVLFSKGQNSRGRSSEHMPVNQQPSAMRLSSPLMQCKAFLSWGQANDEEHGSLNHMKLWVKKKHSWNLIEHLMMLFG